MARLGVTTVRPVGTGYAVELLDPTLTSQGQLSLSDMNPIWYLSPAQLASLGAQIRAQVIDPLQNTEGESHHDGQPTEKAAAKLSLPRTGNHKWVVMAALARRSAMTDEELAAYTGLRPYTAAPRRHDLMKLGFVEDTGRRRPTSSGTEAIVWGLSEQGREWWAANGGGP